MARSIRYSYWLIDLMIHSRYGGLGCPHIPELPLLRDALYLLQGISGKHVQFATGKDRGAEMSLLFVEDSVRAMS